MILNPKYTINPNDSIGHRLLHEGILALSEIESNGIKVDVVYLDKAIDRIGKRIQKQRERVRNHPIGQQWLRKFGSKTNYNSGGQLASILFKPKKFGGLGIVPVAFTEKGQPSTDETALEQIKGVPFVKRYNRLQKLVKLHSTYLLGIRREVDFKGYLHPIFNLHTTQTYRSSSEAPNFQNMPVRNPWMAKIIRRCFIAPKGYVLIENDFKGVEVSIATCYHKDPVMLSYLQDETKDMHRDMAQQIYLLTPKMWKKIAEFKGDKAIRHAAKNKFVFPEFYGDWWNSCAAALWDEMNLRDFKGPEGEPLIKHLRKHGIRELGVVEKGRDGKYPDPKKGTFAYHLREVENDFWQNRFKVYGKWKKRFYKKYLDNGYFDTFTGFRVAGPFNRKQVINYPVQGSAFHCLLWALIRIQRELKKKKMKSKICGQIHDSILARVHLDEVDEYLSMVRRITQEEILKVWKWIILPLVIETEISPIGATWYDKREVKNNKDGTVTNREGTYTGTARGLLEFWKNEVSGKN